MAHSVVTRMQRETNVGAQLGFPGLFGLRPQPSPISREGLPSSVKFRNLPSQTNPAVCVLGHGKSSLLVKTARDDNPPLWLAWPLTAVPFVLGWRRQPFLKLCCCLQVPGDSGGLPMPTRKSVPRSSRISVGWRERDLTCHLLGKLHLQSWKK